ncbi:MAG: ribosome-binding factor A [Opitutae bacterium]|nr:ribosome-binding factor A [Opitutae bacterium]|tara:strand:- start:1003 stop:1389 length:387 start_codon:yes stop_codon:yes gene_type:complete
MGLRGERVNELIRREVSDFIHVRYRSEGTFITVVAARIAPDLRSGRILYSVLGGEEQARLAEIFFRSKSKEIHQAISKRIVLKYLPKLRFVRDDSIEKGNEVLRVLDDLQDPSAATDHTFPPTGESSS